MDLGEELDNMLNWRVVLTMLATVVWHVRSLVLKDTLAIRILGDA